MALKVMQVYCKNCGFSYVDENTIPEDQEVFVIECDCGKITAYHRCKQGKYSKMSVKLLDVHEIEDRKIDKSNCNKQWVCGLAHEIRRKKEGKRYEIIPERTHTCKLPKNHEGKCECSCGVVDNGIRDESMIPSIWNIKIGCAVCPYRELNRTYDKFVQWCRHIGDLCTYENCPFKMEMKE